VSAQENEALVRRYFEEGWAKGNVAAVDEFMAPDYVEHEVYERQLHRPSRLAARTRHRESRATRCREPLEALPLGLDLVELRAGRDGPRRSGRAHYRTPCLEGLGRAGPTEAAMKVVEDTVRSMEHRRSDRLATVASEGPRKGVRRCWDT
jgi:hypothetical protein